MYSHNQPTTSEHQTDQKKQKKKRSRRYDYKPQRTTEGKKRKTRDETTKRKHKDNHSNSGIDFNKKQFTNAD